MRSDRDDQFMQLAIKQARGAIGNGDVPVGAVVVKAGEIISTAHNQREAKADPTAHAEILALRAAARKLGGWRLNGATLYVTLEPCPMCAGAAVAARIKRLVYAAPDEKAGAAWSLYNIAQDPRLNHRCEVVAGVLRAESEELLKSFFKGKRTPRTDL